MKSQFNLIHLKYFYDAASLRSVSEAAKKNFVSQSAVSQAISKLESCLGIPIVVHSRQKFQLTEYGQILYEQSLNIFQAVNEIHVRIAKGHEEITTPLKFVSTKSLGMSLLPPQYQKESYDKIAQNFPKVQVSYRLGNLQFIRNAIQQGEAEFGIVVYDSYFESFNRRLLKKGTFHLFQHEETSHELLTKGILVDCAKGMYVEELMECYHQHNGSFLNIQMELNGWEVVSRFTEIQVGIGFFPDYLLSNHRYPRLKTYPFEIPHFEYEICAIYNKGKALSEAATAFLDHFNAGQDS